MGCLVAVMLLLIARVIMPATESVYKGKIAVVYEN